jgi:hypothetical protein
MSRPFRLPLDVAAVASLILAAAAAWLCLVGSRTFPFPQSSPSLNEE